jgi:uncharacterized OsmC-like protein
MAITQKTLIAITVSAECPTHARTRAHTGGHELVIDEPAARGGTDEGPTPIETMIAALLGCTNVILNRIAEKHRVEVKAFRSRRKRASTGAASCSKRRWRCRSRRSG